MSRKRKIVVVDTEIGNIQSVVAALRRVGTIPKVTRSAKDLDKSDGIVLPGVGAFQDGMEILNTYELIEPLRQQVKVKGKPLLGICLGMQLMASYGEEHGLHQGIDILPGNVTRLKPKGEKERVPNMGWRNLQVKKHNALLSTIKNGEAFYFAHSYFFQCTDPGTIAATIQYGGGEVIAAVEKENIFGVQFHPEKSQDSGLRILCNFVSYVASLSY